MMTLVGMLSLMLAVVGIIGMYNTKVRNNLLQRGVKERVQVTKLMKIDSEFALTRLDVVYASMTQLDDAGIAQKEASIARHAENIRNAIDQIRDGHFTPIEREWLKALEDGYGKYLSEAAKLIKLARERRPMEERMAFARSVAAVYGPAAKAVEELIEFDAKEAAASAAETTETYRKTVAWMIAIVLGSVIASVVFGLLIVRSVTNPLRRMGEMLKDIAEGEGDLTRRLDASGKDEIADVARWFNAFVGKLNDIISNVAQNAEQMASAAVQLSATSTQIATGAEEVAAQAQTVATASEEMAATSMEIASSCCNGADSVKHAHNMANAGMGVMRETVREMERITGQVKHTAELMGSLNMSSERIGEIVDTINDVADQINLLALNAAIEAARAGEYGRGFTVVADEVRKLAEKTTMATKQIAGTIKTIQSEIQQGSTAMEEGVRTVEVGMSKAADSGNALEEVIGRMTDLVDQVSHIATAAEQQTATTSEISSNIHQITQVVADTAKGAQESASATEQLARLAEDLRHLTGKFKTAA